MNPAVKSTIGTSAQRSALNVPLPGHQELSQLFSRLPIVLHRYTSRVIATASPNSSTPYPKTGRMRLKHS